ncbi:alpha/beta fold hydrolase [Mycolicibacterium novocastrense]|uniref:Alpha/beta fold hydrolase n=1 Tax=Mycolicibacterium novocastrense TaxID=59813 RepID=A0AAW5SPS4_MYCNV|nr:alpha/beta fold hydrolase [Mycolicibacterium novocastrense]MCV7025491.1 alpha/beta fold hydrolase [Mycolicibacterium novocastrense]GAT08953.1 alpha/beta hydrolase [Mycolicibacterium novocastrense]
MTSTQIQIRVDGDIIAARRFPATTDALTDPAGRPCVVMAHGLGATQDCGLFAFAEALADTGADVVTFDYRHFAESSGQPRQLVSLAGQVADYHAVIDHARRLEDVDPARIVAWGVSLSGGHVIRVAADDPHLAGVISLTPATDGLSVTAHMLRTLGPRYVMRVMRYGIRDFAAKLRGRPPVLIPVVGAPGEVAGLSAEGAVEGMRRIAGPTWRNEFAARLVLVMGGHRPIARAGRVTCPVLVQIGDLDRTAPPAPATVAATRMRATVHHYPCDHFDVYPGEPWHERVVSDQIAFLKRILAPAESTRIARPSATA